MLYTPVLCLEMSLHLTVGLSVKLRGHIEAMLSLCGDQRSHKCALK